MPSFLEAHVWPAPRISLRTKEPETVIHFCQVAAGGLLRVLLCLFVMAISIAAADDQPVLEVFVPSVQDRWMYPALLQAEAKVTKIYSDIGIRVLWPTTYPMPAGCLKRARYSRIVVDLRMNIPPDSMPKALAFTTLGSTNGACITVLTDRLVTAVQINAFATASLIGNVLAHEIGHVLQGSSRHSQIGIMKANWSDRDVMTMATKQLQFTRFDIELIREGLEDWASPKALDDGLRTVH
jgi:hypothetical protein